MSILCKLFGHQPPVYGQHRGSGGSEYMNVHVFTTDGIGRVHAYIDGRCPRCEATYNVGKIHVPQGVKP